MAKTPAQITSIARGHCPGAISVLKGIMHCETAPHAARVSAAQGMLDRGLGKPAQAVTIDVTKTITLIERRIVDVIDVDHEVVPPDLISHDESTT